MQKLYIISELFPPDETSTAYILGEIANASVQEYEVHVICGPKVYDIRKKLDEEHPFILDHSIRTHRVDNRGLGKESKLNKAVSLFSMSWRLYRVAKKLTRREDKVLIVTNPAPLIIFISHLKNRIGFDFTLLVHDVFPENLTQHNLHIPRFLYSILKKISDRAYAKADRIIALGRDMKEVLLKKTNADKSVFIVENWADTVTIQPVPFPSSDKIVIEYAGNIGRAQGLDKIITNLPEGVELHFYGTGEMEPILKGMNHPGVFFHGPYFRSQQREILGACHASVVALSDGMYGIGVPSKSYNIMASGRPIIYFGPPKSEIALTIEENNIGYIGWPSVWDVKELKMMGERARVLAETAFSKSNILNKFLEAIR